MYERALLQRLAHAHRGACTWIDPDRVAGKVLGLSGDADPTGRRRLVGRTAMFEFREGEGGGRFPHASWRGVTGTREWTVSVDSFRDRHVDREDNLWIRIAACMLQRDKRFSCRHIFGTWQFPLHRRAFDGSGIVELPLHELFLARDAFIEVAMRALPKRGRLDPELEKELSDGFDDFDNFPIEEFTLGERRWTGVERVAGAVKLRQAAAIGDRAEHGEIEAWLGYGEDCYVFYTVVVRRDFVCATRASDFMVDPYDTFCGHGPEVFRQHCPSTGEPEVDAALRNEIKEKAFQAVAEHGRVAGVGTRTNPFLEGLLLD